MKKLYVCTAVLLSTLCAVAQGDKKPSKDVAVEPLKTVPYDYYSIGGNLIHITLPLRYYYQQGTFEQYTITVSNNNGGENATKIMCRILSKIPNYYMEVFDGYDAADTIPPNTQVFVCTDDRSLAASVNQIVKKLPLSFVGQATVAVKKIEKKEKGTFIVMLPEDTKNILRLINSLPNQVTEMRKRSGDSSVVNNLIIHADLGPINGIRRKSHLRYEAGFMDIYYSLRNASEKNVNNAIIAAKTSLQSSGKDMHPVVDRYTSYMFH